MFAVGLALLASASSAVLGWFDSFYSSVVLLVHGNGANGSTAFVDSAPVAKVITANLHAKISTAQSKFGGASAFFDGTDDYCSVPYTADFDFGSGDFTIECWVYIAASSTADGGGGRRAGLVGTTAQTSTFWAFGITGDSTTTGTGLYFETSLAGTSANRAVAVSVSQLAWHHVAVCSTSGACRFFLDGTLYATTAIGQAVNIGGTALCFGRQGSLSTWERYLNGYIDDLRITKGVCRYGAAFTPPTVQLYDPVIDPYFSNTVALLHCNGANGSTSFTDNCFSPKTYTAAGTAQISTAQSKFGGASAIFGSSTANKVTTPANVDLSLLGGSFTIEFWCYPTAYNGSGGFLMGASGGTQAWNLTTGWHWYVVIDTAALSLVFYNGTTGQQSNGVAVSLNAWSHWAFVYDGSNLRIFKDGALGVTQTVTMGAPSANPIFSLNDVAGLGAGPTQTYTGYLDEIRITKGVARYLTAFTPPNAQFYDGVNDPYRANTVLLAHMDGTNGSTTFTDNSFAPKTLTATGATISTAQSKFGGASGAFNGTSAYVGLPASADWNFGAGDFTIEAWVYVTAFAGADRPIFNLRTGSSVPVVFDVSSAGKLCLWGSAAMAYQIVGATTLSLNTWYHVAVSRTGSSLQLFVNGVVDAVATNTAALGDSSNVAKIGAEPAASQYFSGYIDDLRITKGAGRYTANFAPPVAAFPNL